MPRERLRRAVAVKLLEYSNDAIVVLSEDSTLRYISPGLNRLLGFDERQSLPRLGSLLMPGERERVLAAIARMRENRAGRDHLRVRLRHCDGSARTVDVTLRGLLDDADIGGIVLWARPVADTTAEPPDAVGPRHRALVQHGYDVAAIVDRHGGISYVSPAMYERFGHDPTTMVGQSGWDFVHPDDLDRLERALAEALGPAGASGPVEYRLRDGAGHWRWAEERLHNSLDDPTVSGIVVNIRDVTERKELGEQVRRLTHFDPVTGLAGRSLFEERLARAGSRASDSRSKDVRPSDLDVVSVLCCDVDGLNGLNAAVGHVGGDSVLRALAGRIERLVEPPHSVARVDGDVVVLHHTDGKRDDVGALARQLQKAAAAPIEVNGQPLSVTLTVGIATGRDHDQLLPAARAAVERAKAAGRGRIELASMDDEPAGRRQQLVLDLREALEHDDLDLHYQPVVDLLTGGCSGVEALLRWHRSGEVPMAPPDVVSLAEQNGLSDELGTRVLARACADAASWPAGPAGPLSVAVNVSPRQLSGGHLVEGVTRSLEVCGLDPQRLVLEISENALLAVEAAETLRRVRALGVRVALDDFGTGHASLLNLKTLPLDQLKIDRSFVTDLATVATDAAIVSSLTAVAASLDLELVAEGVETGEQAEQLRRLGCRFAQGFHWSPALPSERLPALVERLRPRSLRLRRILAEPVLDPQVVSRLLALGRSGASPHTIAAALNAEGLLTPQGTKWHRNTVAAQLRRLLPAQPEQAASEENRPT